MLFAGEWHAADMTDCAKELPWPVLDRVRMLGLPGKIDEGSVTFEIMTPGKIHPLRTIPLKASKVHSPTLPNCLTATSSNPGDDGLVAKDYRSSAWTCSVRQR